MTHVLIVEDTESISMLYTAMLVKNGFDVVAAGTAKEAEALLLKVDVTIVILDIGLPDRDGLDLLSDILMRKPDMRVIVVTANGSMNKAVEAMRLGGSDFLVKPVNETKFVGAVLNAQDQLRHVKPAAQDVAAASHKKDLATRVRPLIGVALADVERALIEETIEFCDGSLPKAAELMKLAPSTLYRKRDGWD